MSAHTPGAWCVDADGDVASEAGELIAAVASTDADAALLAAAPSMLAVLKSLRDQHDCEHAGGPDEDCAWCEVDSVIAKAEGGR